MNRRACAFRSGAAAAGVTLLELVVVLALLGLITALALPNLQRLQENLARTTERDRILEQLAGLGWEAMLGGRTYLILGDSLELADAQACELGRDSSLDAAGDSMACAPSLAEGYDLYELDLPEGWEARLDRPLVIRANGVCLGAQVRLIHRGRTAAEVSLVPPYCPIHASA